MTAKARQRYIDELNPLLLAAEQAILKNDVAEAHRLSLETLHLTLHYANQLSDADMKAALNNPIANAIATRLGVRPQ